MAWTSRHVSFQHSFLRVVPRHTLIEEASGTLPVGDAAVAVAVARRTYSSFECIRFVAQLQLALYNNKQQQHHSKNYKQQQQRYTRV